MTPKWSNNKMMKIVNNVYNKVVKMYKNQNKAIESKRRMVRNVWIKQDKSSYKIYFKKNMKQYIRVIS
jgi:hypothetical protein